MQLLIASILLLAAHVTVIDGDTVRITSGQLTGERVRIVGLDAPEIHGSCNSERRLAQRAKRRLEGLVAGGGLSFQPQGRDRYGRVLAVMTAHGRDVAEILIGEGLARPYRGGHREGWCD